MSKKRMLVLGGVAVAAALLYLVWPGKTCRSAERRFGIEVPRCPDGKPRQQLAIRGDGLRRGGPGQVHVAATAIYAEEGDADWQRAPVLDDVEATLSLIDGADKATAIPVKKGWSWRGGERVATVELPAVPDGDYRLRARVETGIGTEDVDLPLPLYAPARIHVITDRPLYQPGSLVKFRALALRATDLSPIDHRPGRWLVRDPAGQVLLEEKAPVGEWGVVAGDFPLDRGAATGEWSVVWRSGADEAVRTFKVEPFALPRFRVEAAADRPFYRPGDTPIVRGAVTYSSGAPVAGAAIDVQWRVDAPDWPPPTSWAQGALPVRAIAGDSGRFELRLPEVPGDLVGQAQLIAQLTAADASGDRVSAAATALLSRDAIRVQAITELDGGLVAGFNNRVYLRVTTADGRALPGAAIHVERAWASGDPGLDAVLDEDAVARLQLDPGPPVNVVIPAPPVRPPPGPRVVTRSAARDLITGEAPGLADLAALDDWEPALAGCARWADGADAAQVALQVDERGAITASDGGDGAIDRCVLSAVRTRRLAPGSRRLLALTYRLDSSALPTIRARYDVPLGPRWDRDILAPALRDARECVAADVSGELPWTLTWQLTAGSRQIRTGWNPAGDLPPGLRACLDARLARHPLAAPATEDRIGLARLTVERPASAADPAKAQPTIMQGYELRVAATALGRPLGETRLRLAPGTVPPLRLRATPVLAKAGEKVAVELVRGPDYTGAVPTEIVVDHAGVTRAIKVGRERTATVELPADAQGWYELSAGDARARIYVRSAADLAVSVVPDRPSYPPGAEATLAIHTAVGGRGARAAVGLFGVDESLGQLVALPGPDDLRSVRPEIPMVEPAFGILDAQALVLGRIRGSSAAEATVLRVASLPPPAALDAYVSGMASTEIDPLAELTDRFYRVLGELHAQVRAWEQAAPPAEQMTPDRMARLWSAALDAAKKKGAPIEDAFGRRLRLSLLPPPLLALVDPRQVVVVGTRLPEDVENWTAWVARRKP